MNLEKMIQPVNYLDPIRQLVQQERKQPVWISLLRQESVTWKDARRTAQQGQNILIATSVGGHILARTIESLLAVALTLRGARVHLLLCDEFLPACLQAQIGKIRDADLAKYGPVRHLCYDCFAPANDIYRSLGLPIHRYSTLITRGEREMARQIAASTPFTEIANCQMQGLAVGEHALAGALRYYARGTLEGEPYAEPILRRYFEAALLTTFAIRRLLSTYSFTSACFSHGIYIPHGIIGEVAREQRVRVVNWNVAYRKQCFIFSHHDTYHHMLLNEPVSHWEDMIWTPEMEADILAYLRSRWCGTQDWIWFHETPQEDLEAIVAETGLDISKPCIGLLTNVMWDAQLHYRANAFSNMLEWVLQTIQYFARRPHLQLAIRVHPAEIRGTLRSRQPLVSEIQRAFPILPPNVVIIPPESKISTYALLNQCNAAIIYGTKTGVELTSMGIPTIVAGEAWIRNKGITLDASSSEEYFCLLDQLPLAERLDAVTTQRARQYAYHFFFRRMIPLTFVEAAEGSPPYRLRISSLDDLVPGRDRGLDVICDGILNGSEFIYPAELYSIEPSQQ